MASNKMSLTTLKQHLRKKSDYELIEEIAHLYKTFKPVKEYYQASFFDDEEAIMAKYKQIVRDEFVPRHANHYLRCGCL